jgi:signal transduction histidine kinase
VELALNDPRTAGAERLRLASQMEELRRLSRLVDSLGLVAKADAGVTVIARERLEFGQLVRQATEDARTLGTPIGIAVELGHCDDVLLDGDPAGLRQVLLNLLDNAVKHSVPGGWVRVELRTGETMAALTVDNAAAPLPPELVPRLFHRFARGNGPAAGSGLGLSIAKLVVEAHRGRIDYSAPAEGTVRFALHLPLPRTA